ncbi:MAG TPA: hypothetical protein VIJ21_07260, partial [Solirubrobacterales bacterium]
LSRWGLVPAFLSVVGAALYLMSGTGHVAPPSTASPQSPPGLEKLAWAPPKLYRAKVVHVPNGENPAILSLDPQRDYVVKLPRQGLHGTLEINGGHNVVVAGGEVKVPSTANQTDNGADGTDTAIYVRASTGTVHIEGVLIKADDDTQYDGIDVNAPEATVQVENVRVEDVYGSLTSEHADVIQTWGGVKELDVDGLTARGDYQGLTVAPDLGEVGGVHLKHVDLTAEAAPPSLARATVGGGIMLWLTEGTDTCNSATVTRKHVFIANRTGRIGSDDTVWPSPASDLECAATVSDGRVEWPALPVSGGVNLGAPRHGSFVPVGVAGRSYRSPGYQSP